MNKRCCLIVLFVVLTSNCFSQDSLSTDLSKKKLSISAYFTPSLFYLEPGIQVQYNFSEKHSVEFKYGYLLLAYNINVGDVFPAYGKEQLIGYGSIYRIGYKTQTVKRVHKQITLSELNANKHSSHFYEFRFTYKNLSYPEYCYYDGSTPTAMQTEKKKVEVINIVFGKQLMESEKFIIDFSVIIGYAYSKSNYTKNAYVDDYCNPISAVPEEYQHSTETISRPSFGLGWTFYFKAYEKSFLK